MKLSEQQIESPPENRQELCQKKTTLAAAAFFFFIIFNLLYHQDLFYMGVNAIIVYQQNSSSALNNLNNLFTLFLNTVFASVVLALILLCSSNKLKALNFVSYYLLATSLMGLLKNFFASPRPFWVDSTVSRLQWNCPREFGHPSGHSLLSFLLYEHIIMQKFPVFNFKGERVIKLTLLFLLVAGIIQSRMGLGSHSSDQVVMGIGLGLSIAILYILKLKQTINNLWLYLLQRKQSLWPVITIHAFVLALPVGIYFTRGIQLRPEYITNVQIKCEKLISAESLRAGGLLVCILSNMFFGITYFFSIGNTEKNFNRLMLGRYESGLSNYAKVLGMLLPGLLLAAAPLAPILLIEFDPLAKYLLGSLFISAGVAFLLWSSQRMSNLNILHLQY